MKQPDFTRKAIGLLLAPFALAALPAGAATLDVTNYDGWSDIYEGWDEANNRYFFNASLESSECRLIGVETSETSITVPDAINIVVSHEDWNDETGEYNQWDETISMDVTKVYIHPDDYWMVNPLGAMTDFKEWILNDKIESFVYINWSSDFQNPYFHFTSATAPSHIDLQTPNPGRYVVFAPEGAEAAYKDAFMGHSAMVVAEGADPKAAFEQEIADTNAISIADDNGESGINIVTWTGKDKDGNIFGFEDYDGITLRGIVTNAASIVVPENICFANADIYALEVRPVTRFCLDYYNEENTGFPGCDNLKDIYLPSGIVHAEFHPGQIPGKYNFHFTSEAVPESIYLDGGNTYWGVRPRYVISVPESAKEAYAAAFPEDACLVVAEGEDAKAVMEKAVADLDALLITEGVEGVVNASWSGTDENGVVYAFDAPNYGAITFRGAITNEKSINIPEKVYVTNPDWYAFRVLEVASLDLCYHNDEETCFPNCSNLIDIYVPSSVTYALWNGGGFNGNYKFHFASENVPDIRLYDNAGNNVNIYVPDAAFDNYAEALGDQDYILWSEAEATPVTVNVATPGTLAEEVSSLIENLNSVRWLVVTGTPNDVDLRMIRRLPRLEKLDLS
ncbi:MAG: hypothetical protein K2J78_06915, partial [Muribaculaceae bacterium]|nr:hypothetical protein [Muribaculaceae bacterium]